MSGALPTVRMVCLASAIALMVAAFPLTLAGQNGTGMIEGRITIEEAPAPRRANRYPGGQTAAHQIQPVPAVAYLVGPAARVAAPAGPRPTMTQQDTAFIPAVVMVPVGGTVVFPNADPFFHNVFSYSSAQRFDLGRYPQGESKSVTFPEAGIVEVFCEVHEFMRGAILVAENPFHALIGADGSFRIAGVPAGEHTVVFWHPDHEPVERRVVVTGGGASRVDVVLDR